MAFDQSRPAWMGSDYAQQEEEIIQQGYSDTPKPVLIKKRSPRTSVGSGVSDS
jgi:ATP-dependent RNA helicase DeaD